MVPAPDISTLHRDTELVPTAEQLLSALKKYPPFPAQTTEKPAGEGAKATKGTQGSGAPAVTQGSGGSADLGADAGANQVTESEQTASSTDGSGVQVTQGAGGSDDLGTDVGASRVTESAKPASGGGTSASQETPTTSATPSAGKQAPTAQEALRAALQQSIQQAFAPMQESLSKLNDTLAAGAGRQEKPKDFSERLADWQKRHKLAETFLSPGQADSSGVQSANHGLKHSE